MSGSGNSWATCKSAPQTEDNHANINHSIFYMARCPSWGPTNSVKALNAKEIK